mmetsp:Transcript_142946/g.356214  ORF Transcript_142946/g.356214 Transcript_142946/m.356214 type:complete len:254 (-) Transcript_142946:355-1116(-)
MILQPPHDLRERRSKQVCHHVSVSVKPPASENTWKAGSGCSLLVDILQDFQFPKLHRPLDGATLPRPLMLCQVAARPAEPCPNLPGDEVASKPPHGMSRPVGFQEVEVRAVVDEFGQQLAYGHANRLQHAVEVMEAHRGTAARTASRSEFSQDPVGKAFHISSAAWYVHKLRHQARGGEAQQLKEFVYLLELNNLHLTNDVLQHKLPKDLPDGLTPGPLRQCSLRRLRNNPFPAIFVKLLRCRCRFTATVAKL